MKEREQTVCPEEVFAEMFRQHASQLRNYLYYRTGELTQAEDWVQESFMRLWKNCDRVSPQKAKAYLFKVASNLLKSEMRHRKVVLNFEIQHRSDSFAEDPHFQLEEKEFQEKLEHSISSLPENQRVVFLLNRIDKMTYREIANMLGISVKAVEKRMHKALLKLRSIHRNI